MKKRLRWRVTAAILFFMAPVFAVGAITREVSAVTPAMQQEQPADPVQSPAGSEARKATDANVLGGTAWQLVKISSMDDTVYTPAEKGHYTLEFGADGTMRVQADCNRGNGSWQSVQPGRLTFGEIATTRAMCPPGSLHDRYLEQFKWVRSYLTQNGKLYLATMADGSIMEFEPLNNDRAAATVLGQDVRTADAEEMKEAIITRLFEQYAAQQGIVAEQSEIDAWVANLDRGMRQDKAITGTNADDLTPEEAAEIRGMRQNMARAIITQWKINRELHREYGGRIIFQQFGPEPLDAYRLFFENRAAEGAFTIHDPALAKEFWRYFTDESIHTFYPPGSKEEADALSIAPWEKLGAVQ